jgi:PBP1b-binding outer membrane lipoprotein LpoB
MKKLLIIAIAAFAFTACNNSAKTEETATDSTAATTTEVAPAPEAAPVATDSAAAATTEAAPATTEAAAPAAH